MATEVLAEIDQILERLQSRLPCNINSPENQRLEKRFRRDLAKHFRSLADAFPYQEIDHLYFKYVKESLGSETEDIIDALIRAFGSSFTIMIEGHLAAIYIDGTVQMMTWGMVKGGIPIAYEGPPVEEAIAYAREHGARLVTHVGDTTKERIAKIISDGIKNKRGIPGIQADIQRQFKAWGRISEMPMSRASMIARTETNDALSQAFLDRAKDMDIEAKEIVTGTPCELCASNAAEGIVPINHVFGSGHLRPPFHPNCVCALAPARLPK